MPTQDRSIPRISDYRKALAFVQGRAEGLSDPAKVAMVYTGDDLGLRVWWKAEEGQHRLALSRGDRYPTDADLFRVSMATWKANLETVDERRNPEKHAVIFTLILSQPELFDAEAPGAREAAS